MELYGQRIPTQATLDKYGLSFAEWHSILEEQEGECAICMVEGKPLQIDHRHRPKYSSLPAEERKKWVRGLCCFRCNHKVLGATRYGATAAMFRAAADYLERHA